MPDCGCLDAELADTGGGPGRFWAIAVYAPYSPSAKSHPLWASRPGASYAAGTAPKGSPNRSRCSASNAPTGRVRYRRCRKRKQQMAHNRGFVIVNDGLAVVSQLARYLNAVDATITR